MPKLKSDTVWPTTEEDTCIHEGITADPGTRELTDDEWSNMRSTSEIHPELVEHYLKSQGRDKHDEHNAI